MLWQSVFQLHWLLDKIGQRLSGPKTCWHGLYRTVSLTDTRDMSWEGACAWTKSSQISIVAVLTVAKEFFKVLGFREVFI